MYAQEKNTFFYPCPCGDKFQITVDELLDGEGMKPGVWWRQELARLDLQLANIDATHDARIRVTPARFSFLSTDIARCPSCSLLLRVIYDEEALSKLEEAG